jgi:hypothetical protein
LGPGAGPGPGQGICCSPRTSLPTVTILPCMFLLLVAFEHDPARRQEATMGLAQLCTCINAARSSATRQISCTLPGPTRAHPAKWPLPLSPALLPAAPQRQLQCSAHIAPAVRAAGSPKNASRQHGLEAITSRHSIVFAAGIVWSHYLPMRDLLVPSSDQKLKSNP